MFKKKDESLIKSIIYPENAKEPGQLYRSLMNLFDYFWVYHNKELYLVGGCVRDLLLNKTPKDYDLCTNATPDEVKQICEEMHLKTFDSGIKHGTLTIIDDFYKQSYEITTYRIDGKYEDGRHPEEVTFAFSLEEDLKRRDFTINSFAYSLLTHEVLALEESYFRDLEYGIIRTVGNTEDRFNEDALRMLRALRFSAQLNFSIANDTYEAIKKLHVNISKISKERIRDELTKILLSDNPQVLELFVITGLEKYSFGKYDLHPDLDYDGRIGITPIGDILNCDHQNPWHYTDVFHHTIDVIKRVPKTFELRWAALMHDFGKPAVKELKEGTVDHYHYHGHQDVSVEIAEQLMGILKFSNKQKDLILKYIKYHDADLATCRNGTFKRVLADIGVEHFLDFMKLKTADAYAHQLQKDTKWAIEVPDKVYERFAKVVEESQALTIRDLDINGYDLMDLGLKGKQIGDCLNYLVEEVLEDASKNKNKILISLAKEWRTDRC